MRPTARRPAQRGFTLTELLIAVSILALLSGIGFSLFRGTDPTLATRSAQATVNSLLTATRAQAAVANRPARFVVYGSNPTTFTANSWRAVQIVVQAPDAANGWVSIGEPVRLTDGAFIVPPTSVNLDSMLLDGIVWERPQSPTNPATRVAAARSRFADDGTLTIDGQSVPALHWIEILPSGRLPGTIQAQVVIAPGSWNGDRPLFNNPVMLSGFNLSVYGVPTLVNDPYGF